MRHVARVKLLLLLMAFAAGYVSCDNKQATSPEQRYYYYPKTNVYYDAMSSEYIYSLDSGRNWVKMKTSALSNTPAALGDQVAIKETDENVWYENETHRNMYGGTLYNIITKDTVLLAAKDKPKEVKKATSKQDSVNNSPKKKRNIFQKIFGKKKS